MAEGVSIDKATISSNLKSADSGINELSKFIRWCASDMGRLANEGLQCTSKSAPTYMAMDKCHNSFVTLGNNVVDTFISYNTGIWGLACGLASGQDDNSVSYACSIDQVRDPKNELNIHKDVTSWDYEKAEDVLTTFTRNCNSINNGAEELVTYYKAIYNSAGQGSDAFFAQVNDAANACRAVALKMKEITDTFSKELTAQLEKRISEGKGRKDAQTRLVHSLQSNVEMIDSNVNLDYEYAQGTGELLDWAPGYNNGSTEG